MGEPIDDIEAEGDGPDASEAKVYTQKQMDLLQEQWLCRVWHISAWPFGVFIFSWLFSDIRANELLFIGLGGVAVLWIPAAYHWYRYSKATGNWIWF